MCLMCLYIDVQGCNTDSASVSYYDDECGLLPVPGDDIIYAANNK